MKVYCGVLYLQYQNLPDRINLRRQPTIVHVSLEVKVHKEGGVSHAIGTALRDYVVGTV